MQRDDFPEPLAHLATGRAWDGEAVRAWAKSKGRNLQGDDDPA